MSIRVLIIGAGVGGLCLAQGLRRDGVDVTVFERDPSAAIREQGYRIHIDPHGHRALHECLPAHLYDLHVATSSQPGGRLAAFTETLDEVFSQDFGVETDYVDAHRSVNRFTFRQVLLGDGGDLAGAVRFGAEFTGYELLPDRSVRAHFADGSTASGDVLVAADGIGSRVRAQRLPHARIHDLGIRLVYGRIPITEATAALFPEQLYRGLKWITDPHGAMLGLGSMHFRERPAAAAARLAPGAVVDEVGDYSMCVFGAHRSVVGLSDEDLADRTPDQLWDIVRERTAGWHPVLRELVAAADPGAAFPIAVRTSVPFDRWPASPVTLLGDAVHAMTPAGGVGANAALRDAATLRRALVAADRGETGLLDAVAAYEEDMVGYGFDTVRFSLDQAARLFPRIDPVDELV
jgi:2-polyprenyl-6-methoxyphenol hydroxylase-like FAD-dependent oxidoreductase